MVKRRLQQRRSPSQASENKVVIFFVPTCFLVQQQAVALRSWLTSPDVLQNRPNHLTVAEYNGSVAFPSEKGFDVLVTTPQAFRTMQRRKPDTLGWSKVSLVIFDEVHHVLKDHPYRKIALSIKNLHLLGE
ncbi:unnamed protein product, partial [Amoebophrya sp. A25]|eukprot:GSA25T00001257001.1